MTKEKPYFDPYIFQKVLEYAWLPRIAKEIQEPGSVSHKQSFLLSGFKERAKKYIEGRQRLIEEVVQEETFFQFEVLQVYIGTGEEDKQKWFKQLREDFNLPDDYKFE